MTKNVDRQTWSSSATLAYDVANELTSRTVDGLVTNYTYDNVGRMTGKTMGSYAATYGYDYGDKLTSVTSNFPWESAVTYAYGGDGKRRSRTAGGVTAQYKWGAGFDLVNEETGAGALARTYYGRLADVAGTDPATGAYRYYHHDHLGSTRRVTDQSKATLAAYEYTPYGEDLYASGPADVMYHYATLSRDGASGLDYSPFRYYMPGAGRWLSRDPLGMDGGGSNLYGYALGNPANFGDPLGLCVSWEDFLDGLQSGLDLVGLIPGLGEPFDAISGGISLVRGDVVGAGLSLASVIPFAGDIPGAAKVGRRAFHWLDEGNTGIYRVIKGEAGGPIFRRGNKQIHFHNDGDFHSIGKPHIDLQTIGGKGNTPRWPC